MNDIGFTALLRQTDDHWDAYFLITDNKPFSSRLKEILSSYNDSRLIFLHINRKYRKAVSRVCVCAGLCTCADLLFLLCD